MKKILLILSFLIITTYSARADIERIIAIVNNDVITSYDFYNRVDLVLRNSGLENNKENIDKVSNISLQELIYERLKEQEAKKIGISISQDEINSAMKSLAQENNMDLDSFINQLSERDLNTLQERLRSTLMWNKYIKRKIAPNINITPQEVNEFMDSMKRNDGNEEYLLEKIFYPVDSDEIENTVAGVMNLIHSELEADPRSFEEIMNSFMENPNEGKIGWVLANTLPVEVNKALQSMGEGDVSEVIRVDKGYAIFKLINKKVTQNSKDIKIEDVNYKLMMEELNILQKRKLRDIQESAFIEVKK